MPNLESTLFRHSVSRRSFLQTSCAAVASTAAVSLFAAPATAQSVRSYTLRFAEDGSALTYNGKTPGDVLEAFPGDRIDIHLINELPPDVADADCPADHDHNVPHGLSIGSEWGPPIGVQKGPLCLAGSRPEAA